MMATELQDGDFRFVKNGYQTQHFGYLRNVFQGLKSTIDIQRHFEIQDGHSRFVKARYRPNSTQPSRYGLDMKKSIIDIR